MSIARGGSRMMWAAAADLASPLGPDGPPSDVSFEYYDGSKIRYTWTNYNPSYNTAYDNSNDGKRIPTGILAPGVSSWDSGSTVLNTDFSVAHQSGGLYSDWVTIE